MSFAAISQRQSSSLAIFIRFPSLRRIWCQTKISHFLARTLVSFFREFRISQRRHTVTRSRSLRICENRIKTKWKAINSICFLSVAFRISPFLMEETLRAKKNRIKMTGKKTTKMGKKKKVKYIHNLGSRLEARLTLQNALWWSFCDDDDGSGDDIPIHSF